MRRYIVFLLALCVSHTAYAQSTAYFDLAKEHYTQTDYENFMGCAGHFEGSHDLLLNMQSLYPDHQKSFFDPFIASGEPLLDTFRSPQTIMAEMAPHLDLAPGQQAYLTNRKKFEDQKRGTINAQWDYWKSNAKISDACKDVVQKTGSLQGIWNVQ